MQQENKCYNRSSMESNYELWDVFSSCFNIHPSVNNTYYSRFVYCCTQVWSKYKPVDEEYRILWGRITKLIHTKLNDIGTEWYITWKYQNYSKKCRNPKSCSKQYNYIHLLQQNYFVVITGYDNGTCTRKYSTPNDESGAADDCLVSSTPCVSQTSRQRVEEVEKSKKAEAYWCISLSFASIWYKVGSSS